MQSLPQEIISQIGLPATSYHITRTGYSVAYDPRTRNAIYVYEKLSSDCLNGRVCRDKCQFKEDELIPKIFRSTLKDYQRSGYDRGHLAPAANHKDSEESMSDTFFLSNMCPQVPQFNRGYWAKLEKHVRDLTKEYQTVEIFTGPLYLPKQDADGKKRVTYEVIGDDDVAVPTHFYKVIALRNNEEVKNPVFETYVLPNENISSDFPLSAFRTTVEKVEKAAGVIFYNRPQIENQPLHR
jgi:endonuclease G